MSHAPYRPNTQIVHAGRRKEWTSGIVNPPVYHASTCVFETLEEFDHAVSNPDAGLYYGRRGTPTQWALQEALIGTEPGAAGCRLTPSGVSAIAASLLAALKPGDHLLMVDTAYEPTRGICQGLLKDMGVSTTYYDPCMGADIQTLMRDNTAVIFCESPGSLTFEIQDIPAISSVAHAHGAAVIMDNTWATGLFFNPFDHGVDISVQALTKYVVGHSDAMLGCIMANEAYWPRAETTVFRLGLCAAPDDAYLALRGLRTLPLRLRQHEQAAMEVATFLEAHPVVDKVMHPALTSFPSHDLWKRDFKGASGLFSFTLRMGEREHLRPLLDHMAHFKMGFSWGGFESLILPLRFRGIRTANKPNFPGPALRLHIGLEDTADLIEDLSAGLDRFAKAASAL
ncbi:MAG: cystathionine beta-lyase [Pseudomonadota bacterium]